jgi:hypothetical protein
MTEVQRLGFELLIKLCQIRDDTLPDGWTGMNCYYFPECGARFDLFFPAPKLLASPLKVMETAVCQ